MSEGAPSPPSSPGPSSLHQEMGGRGEEEERARGGGKGGKGKDGEKEVVALQVNFYFYGSFSVFSHACEYATLQKGTKVKFRFFSTAPKMKRKGEFWRSKGNTKFAFVNSERN